MSRTTIITVAVIAVIAVAAVAIWGTQGSQSPDEESTIEFVDSGGNTIKLNGPVDSVVSINTLPAIAMKILYLQDKVDEILFYKTENRYQYFHDAGFNNISSDTPFYSTLTTADYFVENNMKVLLAPTTASPLSATLENSCKEYGITIIKLDCFGETMIEDMEKLVKMFGNPEKSVKALNDYKALRNGVIDDVLSKCSPSDDNLFLFEMMGISAFYNENGELSKAVEKIYGKNAVRFMDLTPTEKVTTTAKGDGPKESLTVIDGKTPITILFLRASAGDNADTIASKWNSNVVKDYNLSYLKDDSVFCIDSEIVTGTMDYIGYVAMAQACGVDTGYSLTELASQYEELYGFPKEIENNLWQLQFDTYGKLIAVVDYDAA